MARAMAAAGVAKEAKRCETLNVSPEGTDLTQGSWHRFHRRWCPTCRRRLLHMPKKLAVFFNGAFGVSLFQYAKLGWHTCMQVGMARASPPTASIRALHPGMVVRPKSRKSSSGPDHIHPGNLT